MNEKEFGEKVASLLQSSLDNVDDATSAKLKSVRRAALARFEEKAHVTSTSWAFAGPLGERVGNLFSHRPLLWAPLIAALLALGITGYIQYWQNLQSESDDVDALLLSGELPVHAYIDKDFDTWLKGYSR
ncbi:MAG: DUF3619 family protein [Pseudomonadota bacterium]